MPLLDQGWPDHPDGDCSEEEPAYYCCHYCGKDMPRGAAGEIPGEGEFCEACHVEFKAEGLVS